MFDAESLRLVDGPRTTTGTQQSIHLLVVRVFANTAQHERAQLQGIAGHNAELEHDRFAPHLQVLLPDADVHMVHIWEHLLFLLGRLLAEPSEQVRAVCGQRFAAFGRWRIPVQQAPLRTC